MAETEQAVGTKKEHQETDPEMPKNVAKQDQEGKESDDQQTIPSISEEELKTMLDNLKTKPTLCLVHTETEVSLFCKSCDELVCTSCIIDGNHGNHTFCKTDDAVMTKKQELEECIEGAMEAMTQSLHQNIKIITKQRENVVDNCKIVSAEIDDRKADMLQQVEAWSINLQSMVREHQRKRLQRLEDLKTESGTCLAYLELFKQNPNYGETIDGKKLIKVLKVLQNHTGVQAMDESEASEGEKEVIFTKGEGATDTMDDWFGNLSFSNNIPVDIPSTQKFQKTKFCDSTIDYISPLDNKRAFVVTEKQLYFVDLSKAKYKQEDLAPLMGKVVYITPVTKQGIYVQQKDSTVVRRVTEAGQIYRFADFKPEGFGESWETMRISDDEMVISITKTKSFDNWSYHKTSKVEIKMTKYNKHGVKEDTSSEIFQEDHFLSQNDFPESVQTASQVYIQAVSKAIPQKPYKPGYIMSLKDKSFTYRGCIGPNPELTFHPKGLCKDQKDHLIVSDFWNNAVHQLSPDGTFAKFLMKEENGLIHPTAVGIDGLNWLWVSQMDGNIHVVKYIPSNVNGFLGFGNIAYGILTQIEGSTSQPQNVFP